MNGEYVHIGVTLVVGLIAYLSNRSINAVEASISEAKDDLKEFDKILREHDRAIAGIQAVAADRG